MKQPHCEIPPHEPHVVDADSIFTAIRRQLAILRDRDSDPRRRALAVSILASLCNGSLEPDAISPAASRPPADTATRMFAYGLRHDDAREWDAHSARSGTITYVGPDRIEQYVGAGNWVAYRPADLQTPGFVIGDQVRIAIRAGTLQIEAIGDNRLNGHVTTAARIRSGMRVFRVRPFDDAEWAALLETTAARYAATIEAAPDGAIFSWTRDAELRLRFEPLHTMPDAVIERLAGSPRCALRIEGGLRADDAESAFVVERALIFAAAFAASAGDTVVQDDSGALLDSAMLCDVAFDDSTRADTFAVASAAARRLVADTARWFTSASGRCDELTVVGTRAWRPDVAMAFYRRIIDDLALNRERTDDAVIPSSGREHQRTDGDAATGAIPLITLTYECVALRIALLEPQDPKLAGGCEDIAALLGAPIRGAVAFAFGNSTPDTMSGRFARDMQRADVLATLLAANTARRIEGIAFKPDGSAFDAGRLTELALHRGGTYAAL